MAHEDKKTLDDGTGADAGTTIETDETTPPIENEEQELDIDSLSEEEIDKLDMSKLDEEGEETTPPDPLEKREEKKVEDASLPPIDDSEKRPEGDAITHDPLKDTKAALTREQQKRADLEKELADTKRKLQEQKIQGFQELTKEQLEELKYDDPDAYVEYRLRAADVEKVKQDSQADAVQVRQNDQLSEIVRFAQAQGVDVNDEKKVGEFFKSDEFVKLDQFVTENFKTNDKGLFTVTQMETAWKALNFDKFVAEKSQAVRSQVLESIEKARTGGSKLDRLPKTGGDSKGRAAGDLTIDDIDRMTETEAETVLKELAGTM